MKRSRTAEGTEEWLISYLAHALQIPEDKIDIDASFDNFGIDSVAAAAMMGDLAKWLGAEVDPVVVFECPTIARLAARVTEGSR
jgi:acyl carrier protein